jgi:hypothetical protein
MVIKMFGQEGDYMEAMVEDKTLGTTTTAETNGSKDAAPAAETMNGEATASETAGVSVTVSGAADRDVRVSLSESLPEITPSVTPTPVKPKSKRTSARPKAEDETDDDDVPVQEVVPVIIAQPNAVQPTLPQPAGEILKPESTWPPPLYFSANATSEEKYYINYRWNSQWEWYDKKASDAKKRYQTLQVIVVVGAAAVPVLVSMTPAVPSFVPIIISLAVTIAAGVENVFKYGDNWRNFRQAAEDLKREKSLYDVKAGPYRKAKRPFLLLVQRCEDIMSKQNGSWLQLSEEQGQQQAQTQAEDIEINVSKG